MILYTGNCGGKGKTCLKQAGYNIRVSSCIRNGSFHFFSASLGSDGTKCKRPRVNDWKQRVGKSLELMFVQPIQGLLGVASVLVWASRWVALVVQILFDRHSYSTTLNLLKSWKLENRSKKTSHTGYFIHIHDCPWPLSCKNYHLHPFLGNLGAKEEIAAAPHKPADQPPAFLKQALTFCSPSHPSFEHLTFSSAGFRQALFSWISSVWVAGVRPWGIFGPQREFCVGNACTYLPGIQI